MPASNIDVLPLGKILQIAFNDGIRNQISTDFRDFEMVKRAKVSGSLPRELRFMFQTSLGAAAIQYASPGAGANRVFPNSQQVKIQENTAVMKELQATIELEYNLFDRARKSPERYGQPLEIEINSKMSAAKRRLAADLYGDGTGVVGTVASATPLSGTTTVVTLSSSDTAKGHIGFFEYYDINKMVPLLRLPAHPSGKLSTRTAPQTPLLWKEYLVPVLLLPPTTCVIVINNQSAPSIL